MEKCCVCVYYGKGDNFMDDFRNPNDPRIKRTKRNLKNSFLELMKEKPYHAITVTDIVNKAEYNRTTFYRHYETKDELVQELCDDIINDLIYAFRYPYRNASFINPAELKPSDVIIFDYIMKHKNFYSLWKHGDGIPGFQNQIIHTMIQLYKSDIHYQAFGGKDDYLIIYQAYGVWGLIINWINNDFQPSAEEMANELIKIINYKPPKVYQMKQPKRIR